MINITPSGLQAIAACDSNDLLLLGSLNPDGNPNDFKIYLNNTLNTTLPNDITKILNGFQLLRSIHRSPPGPVDGGGYL